MAAISVFRRRVMSAGNLAGPNTANHCSISALGTPASAKVGTLGIRGERFSLVIASTRSLPAW